MSNSRLHGRSPSVKERPRISHPIPTASGSTSPPPRTDPCACSSPLPLRRGRRRILLPLFGAVLFVLVLFSSHHDLLGLPPAVQGLQRVSPASIAALVRPPVDEIHGLLYYALHDSETLAHGAPDPTRPLALSVYADGDLAPTPDWPARVKHLNSEAPLIVFSKTYCPYSKRAKDTLALYDLVPPPKVVEVDLRDDGAFIKAVLTRLTGLGTFPNVILHGKSIGGVDEITAMHKDGQLRQLFEKAGLQVRVEQKDDLEIV
ncbi:thioredoxin-like protein [Russula earlei]|uniref:Thioredoxin-like protein n=1 Tax=Russula earlei TaxID=71964 RepID=A0ACC0U195_9AGAM|nr:thioredoxin-like protein [Russula earlei]